MRISSMLRRRIVFLALLVPAALLFLPGRITARDSTPGFAAPHNRLLAQQPTLRRGSRGAAVRELQQRLNAWIKATPRSGLRALPVNGVFGPQTETAVKVFQASKGLRANGVVGPETWAALPAAAAVAPPPARMNVNIQLPAFKPTPLVVKAGTTVTWTNQDGFAHTVTRGTSPTPGGAFDSGLIASGQSFSFTFTRPGVYSYFCQPHPFMQGEVRVTAN